MSHSAPTVRVGELDVLPLNLGGNVFGWTADRQGSFDVLDTFVAGGGNFIDTADSYSAWVPGNSGGESEAIIGAWLADRGGRDDVVIATKVAQHPEFKGLSSANVERAADASLVRLGTEHIDLYYAHQDDPEVPIAEMAGAFSGLVDAGKVRHIALSNFSPERIDAWCAAAEADGLHLPVGLQPLYSLVERGFETSGLANAAERHNLAVMPYYALASGFLTGKYRPGVDVESVRAGGAAKYLDSRGTRVLHALDAIAEQQDVSVAAVALAWLRAQPGVVIPVASARTVEHVAPLVESASLQLTPEQAKELSTASA